MMISIEEMQLMLDDIAAEFPGEFFDELNGGILLLPEAKQHKKSKDNDLFILGEYHRSLDMGRYITIYYRSFVNVYGHLDKEALMKKLRETVKHEFRHHLESLAGANDLEIIDEENIEDYLSGS
jgi:predicted Zn-dependent protease with MMP-like domain